MGVFAACTPSVGVTESCVESNGVSDCVREVCVESNGVSDCVCDPPPPSLFSLPPPQELGSVKELDNDDGDDDDDDDDNDNGSKELDDDGSKELDESKVGSIYLGSRPKILQNVNKLLTSCCRFCSVYLLGLLIMLLNSSKFTAKVSCIRLFKARIFLSRSSLLSC